jgi:hypothetical protein
MRELRPAKDKSVTSDAVGHCGYQAMHEERGWLGLMEEKG